MIDARLIAHRLLPAALLFAAALLPTPAHAQTETASIRGTITDSSGAVVPGTTVRLADVDRGTAIEAATENDGVYTFANALPGKYRVDVEKAGFRTVQMIGITLNVQQNLEQNFKLEIGSPSETITVESNAENLNTSDATVSTLVDNQFVESMPLNGRSFGSLLDLVPGVVLNSANFYDQGQFSVNGQRPDANYFTVDGVSANIGTNASNPGQGGAGQLPATSAFGGMSNLVSLDALQEFRVQTSTFAPEFGSTPGAQVSVATKSGTNDLHGTAFEYFRNDVLDANDWFADNKGLKKAALRQNDFGGVLGGPIRKDELFFFGSYEGLRVRQPQVANTYEPTLATRQSAPAAVQPLLNAFPKPNGPDLGNGTAGFAATYSDPSSLDSFSGRIDYLSKKATLFGRYSDAPSSIQQRGAGAGQENYNNLIHTNYRLRGVTLGSNQLITSRLTNETRFNYSRSRAHTFFTLDDFGGGVPPLTSAFFPSVASPQNSDVAFFGDLNPYGLKYLAGELGNNLEQQINVTDNLAQTIGSHLLKFGLDYRRLRPEEDPGGYTGEYVFGSLPNVLANKMIEAFVISRTPSTLAFPNWSLFAQDTWKASKIITLTYGLRWDYDAAPSSPNGTLPFTVTEINNFATMTLAPAGTPLWHAQKDDLAPRLGIAWNPRHDLVIRAGAGVFYDLGYSLTAAATVSYPYGQSKTILNTSFPLNSANAAPPPFTTSPPYSSMLVVDPNHVLPRTYEWNAALEQSLSRADVFELTYVGAGGRKLMRDDFYNAPNPDFTGQVQILSNHGTSNYDAVQAEYRHRVTHGLQTLLSYTWGHSIDDVSSDGNYQNGQVTNAALDRGPSDYDVRQTFSSALSYNIPGPATRALKQIFGDWSADTIIYVRTAPPVNVVTGKVLAGTVFSGASSAQRPSVVPNQPFYLHPSGAAGGKIINAAAFTTPVPATAQGNLGRNALRAFGATQWDMTLRRQFRFTEKLGLQFRSDFFNLLNHPNFGRPINYLSSPQFGQSTQMLNSSLGGGGQNGGLNPLYQIGGPRSIQLAAKLQF
ncbi:MAG: TonB-dependent receptor domain-containing protein [Terracidiphilus sp.]